MNKVILIGRVGKDPEFKELEKSIVANFSVATTERWKDTSGEKKESTEWHQVVAWKNLAEIVRKIIKKGQLVSLEGKNRTRSWTDDSGKTHYRTEVVIDSVTILSSKPADDDDGQSAQSTEE